MGNRSLELTGKHQGATLIIAGTSPNRPRTTMPTDAIWIGVNNFPLQKHCAYWITCDTHRIKERMSQVIPLLTGMTTFMNFDFRLPPGVPPPNYWFSRPKGPVDENHQPLKAYCIPKVWRSELQHVWTSATAAANLAMIMGAREIILYQVDLTGLTLCGGVMKPWANYAGDVSRFLNNLSCPVYKTNPDSPLGLPLYE